MYTYTPAKYQLLANITAKIRATLFFSINNHLVEVKVIVIANI